MIKTKDVTPYELLAFQYKPLERKLKQALTPAQWAQYRACSWRKKIYILDSMAKEFGL